MSSTQTYLSVTIFVTGSLFGALFGFWTTVSIVIAVLAVMFAMSVKQTPVEAKDEASTVSA